MSYGGSPIMSYGGEDNNDDDIFGGFCPPNYKLNILGYAVMIIAILCVLQCLGINILYEDYRTDTQNSKRKPIKRAYKSYN